MTSHRNEHLDNFFKKFKMAGGDVEALGALSGADLKKVVAIVNRSHQHQLRPAKTTLPRLREVFDKPTANILTRHIGACTLVDVARCTEPQLLRTRSLGPHRVQKIKEVLAEHGLQLKQATR